MKRKKRKIKIKRHLRRTKKGKISVRQHNREIPIKKGILKSSYFINPFDDPNKSHYQQLQEYVLRYLHHLGIENIKELRGNIRTGRLSYNELIELSKRVDFLGDLFHYVDWDDRGFKESVLKNLKKLNLSPFHLPVEKMDAIYENRNLFYEFIRDEEKWPDSSTKEDARRAKEILNIIKDGLADVIKDNAFNIKYSYDEADILRRLIFQLSSKMEDFGLIPRKYIELNPFLQEKLGNALVTESLDLKQLEEVINFIEVIKKSSNLED